MSDFFDELEVRDPAARESALMAALPGQLAHAKTHAPFYTDHLAEIDVTAVTNLERFGQAAGVAQKRS